MEELKQLPDIERPELACYKAVVESTSRPVGGAALWPWPGAHRLRLFPLDTHPIAARLGLQVNQQTTLRVRFRLPLLGCQATQRV